MAANALLRYFPGIVFSRLFHVEERSICNSLFDLSIGVAKDYFREFTKSFQFAAVDVGNVLLFEALNVYSAIVPSEEDDRSRTARFPFACPSDALLDHTSPKIRVDEAIIRSLSCPPKIGVGKMGSLCEANGTPCLCRPTMLWMASDHD